MHTQINSYIQLGTMCVIIHHIYGIVVMTCHGHSMYIYALFVALVLGIRTCAVKVEGYYMSAGADAS